MGLAVDNISARPGLKHLFRGGINTPILEPFFWGSLMQLPTPLQRNEASYLDQCWATLVLGGPQRTSQSSLGRLRSGSYLALMSL